MLKEKKVISKRQRMVGIIAAILLIVSSAVGLLFSMQLKTQVVETVLYAYQVEVDSTYSVLLRPNSLYETQWLGEGAVYAEALTDYVQFNLNAAFRGSEPATVKGGYQIAVVVEGYEGAAATRQVVYCKEFPIKKALFPESKNGMTKMEEVVNVDLSTYRSYAEQAEQILQSNVAEQCTLTVRGTLQVDTEYGKKDEEFTYEIPLALGNGTSLYQIVKPNPLVLDNQITEQQETTVLANVKHVVASIAVIILGLCFLAFLYRYTRLPNRQEHIELQQKEILRKYGGRMSRVKSLPPLAELQCMDLVDIDSLLLLAEELRLPLCYCPDDKGLPQEGMLYCLQDKQIHLFQMDMASTTFGADESAEDNK